MCTTSSLGLQLLLDLLGQDLSEFNAPLVKAVDVPDDTFGEDQPFVVCDERAESGWSDLISQDVGGRSVAQEGFVSDQFIRGTLGLDFVGSLANGQSLSLGKEIRCQQDLVQVVLDGVVGFGSQDEVGGDQLGALMQQLEEGMLGVGGRFAKEDGTGGVLDIIASAGHSLAVGLHGELLQVCGEAVKILVKGCDEMGLSTKEVRIPDAEETTNDWNVVLEWGRLKVVVDGVSTGEELVEVFIADVKSDRQADGGPDRISTTHPAFETEHVLGVDSEFGNFFGVGGQGNEMFGNVLLLCGLEEPLLCGIGIGDGLGGGEGLGGNEEESGLRVGVLESLDDMGAIDV